MAHTSIKDIIQILFLAITTCSTSVNAAELRFAKIFTDHCVLQREMSVPVWGWTTPDSQVTIEFAGQKKTATADGNGKWLARLGPMKATRGCGIACFIGSSGKIEITAWRALKCTTM